MFRWISLLIPLAFMVYFLYNSVLGKKKHPMKLFGYLAIALLANLFFFYRLVRDTINNKDPKEQLLLV